MGAFTDYLENKILDHLLGRTTYTAPETLYVGLAQSVSDDGTITGEPSGNGYQRVAVANNTTNFPSASNGQKSNANSITFPQATGSWGTINYVFIADAATGGNVLFYAQLTTPKTIGEGDTVSFPSGGLTFTLD